jgi:hypothetical protein
MVMPPLSLPGACASMVKIGMSLLFVHQQHASTKTATSVESGTETSLQLGLGIIALILSF